MSSLIRLFQCHGVPKLHFGHSKQPVLGALLMLMVADGLIVAGTSPDLRYGAALILLAFLPGWVWLGPFLARPVHVVERLILAIGLSLALTIFGTLLAVYLPGPISTPPLLIVTNLLVIAGLSLRFLSGPGGPKLHFGTGSPSGPVNHQPSTVYPGSHPSSLGSPSGFIISLIILLILAAALRLPRLGYAEFHEDEAEALIFGVRLLQGEDYALFLHRKGPAQMLVPLAFWLFSGQINETFARFPFALSSILSVAVLCLLGRRWLDWRAGLVAGLLWAINGYAIGFGRMVQYQALIFFLEPLAIYCLYLAWQDHQPRLQILAALLLAATLLAHFDALLLLPVAVYLAWLISPEKPTGGPKLHFGLALLLFLALLASFYLPFLLDPEFGNTITYLTESRVKPGLLYNNLDRLQRFDKDYSSHFYLPTLGLGLLSFAVWGGARLSPKWRWAVAGLGLLAGSTVWLPDVWRIGPLSLAVLPWLMLGLIYTWFAPQTELKLIWLMPGGAFIGYLFLVDDPRTHLYLLYPGLILLAGGGWVALAKWLASPSRPGGPKLRFGLAQDRPGSAGGPTYRLPSTVYRLSALLFLLAGGVLVGASLIYVGATFLQTETAFTRLRAGWDGSVWEAIYDDFPKARSYFGYPKREGWKAIGALRNQGLFPGDFRSLDEDFIIPVWYNYGQARSCYDTPAHIFVRATAGEDEIETIHDQYTEVGQVAREGEIRLHVFAKGPAPVAEPVIYPLAAFEDQFDQFATPQQFAHQAEPGQAVGTQFGAAIKFVGYDLPEKVVAPGDVLPVTLYWQALVEPGDHYRAFVHLTDGSTLWGQHDDDPICRLPTTIWRSGQRGAGQFRLPVDPETPPGHYLLIIGLYQAESLERLKIRSGPGQPGDDFLWLGDVEVR